MGCKFLRNFLQLGLGQEGEDDVCMELWRKRIVANLPSFFLSVWDMKECEKERMMMTFVRMGGGVVGIMKSWKRWDRKEVELSWRNKLLNMQSNQHMSWELKARSSNGGGGGCSKGSAHYVWWLEMSEKGKKRGTWSSCWSKKIGVEKEETNMSLGLLWLV